MNVAIRLIHSTILIVLVLSFLPTTAFADEHEKGGASFGLRPVRYDPDRPETKSYFVYDAFPGQVIYDEALLVNQGTKTGTARLYPVDATTGQTSGTVFLSMTDPKTGVGAWVTHDETEITLAPGEERVISFSVTVPEDARDGQHVGGFVAEDVELRTGAQDGALQVQILNRVAVAIQVNLPGPAIEKMSITNVSSGVQSGYQALFVGLRNDGNRMLKPTGEIVITGSDEAKVQRIPMQLDTILPGTEIAYPVIVPGQALSAGTYTVSVTLDHDTEGVASLDREVTISSEETEQVTGSVVQLPPSTPDGPGTQSGWLRVALAAAVAVLGVGVIAMLVLRLNVRARTSATSSSVTTTVPGTPVSASGPSLTNSTLPRPTTVKQLRPPVRVQSSSPAGTAARFGPISRR